MHSRLGTAIAGRRRYHRSHRQASRTSGPKTLLADQWSNRGLVKRHPSYTERPREEAVMTIDGVTHEGSSLCIGMMLVIFLGYGLGGVSVASQ